MGIVDVLDNENTDVKVEPLRGERGARPVLLLYIVCILTLAIERLHRWWNASVYVFQTDVTVVHDNGRCGHIALSQ